MRAYLERAEARGAQHRTITGHFCTIDVADGAQRFASPSRDRRRLGKLSFGKPFYEIVRGLPIPGLNSGQPICDCRIIAQNLFLIARGQWSNRLFGFLYWFRTCVKVRKVRGPDKPIRATALDHGWDRGFIRIE